MITNSHKIGCFLAFKAKQDAVAVIYREGPVIAYMSLKTVRFEGGDQRVALDSFRQLFVFPIELTRIECLHTGLVQVAERAQELSFTLPDLFFSFL